MSNVITFPRNGLSQNKGELQDQITRFMRRHPELSEDELVAAIDAEWPDLKERRWACAFAWEAFKSEMAMRNAGAAT